MGEAACQSALAIASRRAPAPGPRACAAASANSLRLTAAQRRADVEHADGVDQGQGAGAVECRAQRGGACPEAFDVGPWQFGPMDADAGHRQSGGVSHRHHQSLVGVPGSASVQMRSGDVRGRPAELHGSGQSRWSVRQRVGAPTEQAHGARPHCRLDRPLGHAQFAHPRPARGAAVQLECIDGVHGEDPDGAAGSPEESSFKLWITRGRAGCGQPCRPRAPRPPRVDSATESERVRRLSALRRTTRYFSVAQPTLAKGVGAVSDRSESHTSSMTGYPVLEFDVSEWLNWPDADPESLRGKVVLVKTFQMLCPGCISYGLPQAEKVHRSFRRDEVAVIGLHTVPEHHEVMGPEALKVFLHEYRVDYPIGIDRPVAGTPIPATMSRYGLQGTPSTPPVDRAGQIRHSMFGAVEDLALGALLGRLLSESAPATVGAVATDVLGETCRPGVGCD